MSLRVYFEKMEKYWGRALNQASCEEASEFIQALSKLSRYESGIGVKEGTNSEELRQDLIDEIGDLMICFEMLQIRYDIADSEILNRIEKKVERKYE